MRTEILERWKRGSITVFLTIVFLLLFSLFGVTFENVRILSSYGYIRVAAHSAAMTTFGDFNKELYEQYGLFGYGGYDAMDENSLKEAFLQTLKQNLQTAPKMKTGYMDFYRLVELNSQISNPRFVTDEGYFYEQIKAYTKYAMIEDISDKVLGKTKRDGKGNTANEKLTMAQEYEEGKYDKENRSETEKKSEPISTEEKDEAGGNPLEALSELVNNGILSLVCDENRLADGDIEVRDEKEEMKNAKKDVEKEESATGFLRDICAEERDTTVVEQTERKIMLMQYVTKQFSSYVENKKKTIHYAREYLISGETDEQSALASVVKSLLATRMPVNFVHVVSDASLQQKSMATATAIAGITGLPPVVKAVQYVILLILAFEEACIDVTALLEGRYVPTFKNASNFKMKYAEICMGTKKLFQRKAKAYPKEHIDKLSICYEEYLWLYTLLTSEEKLRERSLDLIQYDLRQRYNQTFLLEDCVGSACFCIDYRQKQVFTKLPFFEDNMSAKAFGNRSVEVNYGYKSE